jgi:hypothetical protein
VNTLGHRPPAGEQVPRPGVGGVGGKGKRPKFGVSQEVSGLYLFKQPIYIYTVYYIVLNFGYPGSRSHIFGEYMVLTLLLTGMQFQSQQLAGWHLPIFDQPRGPKISIKLRVAFFLPRYTKIFRLIHKE